jgi:hypothetical protein
MSAQACCVAGIKQFHTIAKCDIFNPLVVRQIQLAGESGLLNVPFQRSPTRKACLARDGKLRITEAQVRSEDFVVACTGEARMKFSDPLGHPSILGGVSL